ncbi:MAG TPA: protein kinase, partial [Longimicrobiales bacterium]|nr:protein kinase [Longimicrobiales bacterium]
MSRREAEVLSMLEQLLDVEDERRAALLDELTDGQPDLRARLEELLEIDASFHPLLDADALDIDRALRGDVAPAPGDQPIPGYRIIRELGRGGMGVVYLAERTNVDFVQQVAIKVIAADAHQDMLAERMRRERRILAQLRHPNIAQMYDGGVTAAGRPYLVMEYVEGE